MSHLDIPQASTLLQRRKALRSRSPSAPPRITPPGPRSRPERQTTRINVKPRPQSLPFPVPRISNQLVEADPPRASLPPQSRLPSPSYFSLPISERHRHDRLSINSDTSSSSSTSLALPITPLPTSCDLPVRTLPQQSYEGKFPIQPNPSIHVQRGYSTLSIGSNYSQVSMTDEKYDAEKVRSNRLKMAEELLARRKQARRRSTGNSTCSTETTDWERAMRFESWERNQVEAMKEQRRLEMEMERSREYKEWERRAMRERATSLIREGATSLRKAGSVSTCSP